MDGLLERLRRGEVLVGDGAWGTQLMERGLPPGQPPEWFALEQPEVLEEVARLYVEAGADLVTTDTFGGTSFRLKLHGLDGERARINRQAVEAVRRAVSRPRPRVRLGGPVRPAPRALRRHVARRGGGGVRRADRGSRRRRGRRPVHRDDGRPHRGDPRREGGEGGGARPAGDGHHDLRAHAPRLLHRDGRERREGGPGPRGGGGRRGGLELRHRHRGHGRRSRG